jgi:hypothetical protein
VADQLAGQERPTQFGRAMAVLGVALILANSPQAKGRVERRKGVLPDRLVKALRLAKINDLESANRFLDETYLREFHQRFARKAARPLDAHQGLPRNLDEVLNWEEERVGQRDGTVACEGKWYQLPGRPVRLKKIKPLKAARGIRPPAENHPWRRSVLGVGRAVRFGPGDSGQPPLRSGLPASPGPNRGHKQTTSTNKRGHSLVSYQGDISKKF